MTEDQIKAIAEEFARQNPPSTTDEILKHQVTQLNAEQVFEPFLRFLNERYCIVEREKVIAKYNEIKDINDICDNFLADDRAFFYYFFGTSMFNQDEE